MHTHGGHTAIRATRPLGPRYMMSDAQVNSHLRQEPLAHAARALDLARQRSGPSPCQVDPPLWDGFGSAGDSAADLHDRHQVAADRCISECAFYALCLPLAQDPSLEGTVAGFLLGKGDTVDRVRHMLGIPVKRRRRRVA